MGSLKKTKKKKKKTPKKSYMYQILRIWKTNFSKSQYVEREISMTDEREREREKRSVPETVSSGWAGGGKEGEDEAEEKSRLNKPRDAAAAAADDFRAMAVVEIRA